jgi:drug/metabolite transporter (DMT)-like permease
MEPAQPVAETKTPAGPQAALLLMVAIWAVNFSVAKRVLDTVSPLAFNALRFPLAAVVVWAALRWRGRLPLPARADLLRIAALGVLGNIVYQQLFIFGLANTRAGTASVLLAGTPIVTALLSASQRHERVTTSMWIGVLATMSGIILVVMGSGQTPGGTETLFGDLLMLGATVAWAAYTVGSRNLVQRYGSVAMTAWTLWIGAIGILLLGIPDLLEMDLRALSAATWSSIVYAGALSIGVAYLLWYHGVRQLGSTRTAVYGNLVPAVALGVAWVWLGERPGALQFAGAAVILAGVTLAQRKGARQGLPATGGRALPP